MATAAAAPSAASHVNHQPAAPIQQTPQNLSCPINKPNLAASPHENQPAAAASYQTQNQPGAASYSMNHQPSTASQKPLRAASSSNDLSNLQSVEFRDYK